jgi:hypothetical protein
VTKTTTPDRGDTERTCHARSNADLLILATCWVIVLVITIATFVRG